jgi:hypothetical protein
MRILSFAYTVLVSYAVLLLYLTMATILNRDYALSILRDDYNHS